MVSLSEFERLGTRSGRCCIRSYPQGKRTAHLLTMPKAVGEEVRGRLGDYVDVYVSASGGRYRVLLASGTSRTLSRIGKAYSVCSARFGKAVPEGRDRVLCAFSWEKDEAGSDCALFEARPEWEE